jgi:hypothetical protein
VGSTLRVAAAQRAQLPVPAARAPACCCYCLHSWLPFSTSPVRIHPVTQFSPVHPTSITNAVFEQVAGRRAQAARSTYPLSSWPMAHTCPPLSAATPVSSSLLISFPAFHFSSGASLRLNLCSNVPDSEIPEVCLSLVKTVGYKMYYIGERQARLHLCSAIHCALMLRRFALILGSRSSPTGRSSTAATRRRASGQPHPRAELLPRCILALNHSLQSSVRFRSSVFVGNPSIRQLHISTASPAACS